MADQTYYFSHDYNSRSDPKIKKLIFKHGMLGYGIYWAIVEDLYQNANALPTHYDCIADDLRMEQDIIESIINDFDLFQIDGNYFSSFAVERRLNLRLEKSQKARESAEARWNKNKKKNANALRTECDRNAIKGKEIKENKKIKEKIKEILEQNNIPLTFLKTTIQWMEYKTARKESYKTDKSLQVFCKKLFNLSQENPKTAVQIIENSMANNWAGIFPLDKKSGGKSFKPSSAYRPDDDKINW